MINMSMFIKKMSPVPTNRNIVPLVFKRNSLSSVEISNHNLPGTASKVSNDSIPSMLKIILNKDLLQHHINTFRANNSNMIIIMSPRNTLKKRPKPIFSIGEYAYQLGTKNSMSER